MNKMQFNWDGGVYVQDQWRLGSFTINLGARYDKFNAFVPAQSVPDSNFVKGYRFRQIVQHARLERLGDPDRRRLGRVRQRQDGAQGVRRPLHRGRSVLAHRAVQPDLQPAGQAGVDRSERRRQDSQSGPVGAVRRNRRLAARNFGSPDTVDKQDPDLKRDKNWTYELTAQQELFPRVSVFGGYYRRHFYDLAWTDNLATANFVDANNPGDWIPFTYIGPADPHLPNGGNEAITMYNLRPDKIPAVNQRHGYLTNAPDDFRTYNGVEIGTNVKLPKSGFAMASLTSGKTHIHDCTVDNPNSLRFCDRTIPFRHILKFVGGVPLPYRHHAQRRTSRSTTRRVRVCSSRRRTTRRT